MAFDKASGFLIEIGRVKSARNSYAIATVPVLKAQLLLPIAGIVFVSIIIGSIETQAETVSIESIADRSPETRVAMRAGFDSGINREIRRDGIADDVDRTMQSIRAV